MEVEADVWRHYDDESVHRVCVCVCVEEVGQVFAYLRVPPFPWTCPRDVRFPRGVRDASPRRWNFIDFLRNRPSYFACLLRFGAFSFLHLFLRRCLKKNL